MSRMRGERAKLQRPAFVLNTRAVGIGASRSLAMKGVPVVAVDFRKEAAGMMSKSFDAYYQIPDIHKHPDSAVEELLRIQGKHGEKGVLYPASDAFILFTSRYRRKLSGLFDMAIPSEEVLEGIINKKRQYENAMSLGIPIPETHFPTGMDDLDAFKNDIQYPVLIKPYYSHQWQQVFDNKGVQVFKPEELERQFRKVLELEIKIDVMVQRVILGPSTNLGAVRAYIDRKGEAHGVIETQKIRQYPVDFGISSLTQTMHNEKIRELGMRFMKGIGYRGIGSVEFKLDMSDGIFKMMELNARVVKNIGLSTKAGINLPWLMYQDMIGMPIDEDAPYADNVRWHDFVMDCRAYMTLRSRKETTFKEWMRTSLGAECHPYFDWKDLGPALVQTRYGFDPARELFYITLFNLGKLFMRS